MTLLAGCAAVIAGGVAWTQARFERVALVYDSDGPCRRLTAAADHAVVHAATAPRVLVAPATILAGVALAWWAAPYLPARRRHAIGAVPILAGVSTALVSLEAYAPADGFSTFAVVVLCSLVTAASAIGLVLASLRRHAARDATAFQWILVVPLLVLVWVVPLAIASVTDTGQALVC